MKRVAQVISYLALAGTLAPAVLFFADEVELAVVQHWMLGGALVWFVATPVWMEHRARD